VRRCTVAALVCLLAVGACDSGGSGKRNTLTVFAAASLTESFTTIGHEFERANPGVRVKFNFGPSDGLATGIVEGGTADVFASASIATMDRVAAGPRIIGRAVFARNRLVVIVPKDNPAHITSLADLARPSIELAIAAPGVPAGDYARQLFKNVRQTPRGSFSNEVDVKSVVQAVSLGEADAGICYATDVTASVAPEVKVIDIPDAVNVIASYPIAIVRGTKHGAAARAFVRYVLGSGQTILRSAGFLAPA